MSLKRIIIFSIIAVFIILVGGTAFRWLIERKSPSQDSQGIPTVPVNEEKPLVFSRDIDPKILSEALKKRRS